MNELKNTDVHRRSKEIQELFGHMPPWIIRSGMVLVSIFLIILFLLAYIIKYPDVISGECSIHTKSIPIVVESPYHGLITEIFIENGSAVENGQKIFSIISVGSESITSSPKRTDENKNDFFSSIEGQIFYRFDFRTGNYITESTELYEIYPQEREYLGYIELLHSAIGKIEKGQKVLIDLENYPSSEYGSLEGTVSQVFPIPKNGNYIVEVKLIQELTTSYNKEISFMPEMKGTASILVSDQRLIEKLFGRVNVVKNLEKNE